ncbi:MAG: DUF3619 family protein [Betaproteobacteria bacterium]|nr:DUF3619 family protein [Betaproteobacteria bacterium]
MLKLADDLPPETFIDREFIEWLKDDPSPHRSSTRP